MRKLLPEPSAVQTLEVAEVMMVQIHANKTRTAHGASATLKISVESLFWDAVKVGSLLRDMNAAVLVAGTPLDVQHTGPNTEATASAQTEHQASGSNQADGTSVSVAASAASTRDSQLIWIQVKFLWASPPLSSPVPAE